MDIKNLKEMRKQKGWTRKNLADKLAVSVKTVQAWEQGFRVPRPSALLMLEELFNKNKQETVFNKFVGIGINMESNVKIVRLYTNEEKLNSFVKLLLSIGDDKLNGYSLFILKTIDITSEDLLSSNEIIDFSKIQDIEITKVYKKGLSINDIKRCQLRVNVLEK